MDIISAPLTKQQLLAATDGGKKSMRAVVSMIASDYDWATETYIEHHIAKTVTGIEFFVTPVNFKRISEYTASDGQRMYLLEAELDISEALEH